MHMTQIGTDLLQQAITGLAGKYSAHALYCLVKTQP